MTDVMINPLLAPASPCSKSRAEDNPEEVPQNGDIDCPPPPLTNGSVLDPMDSTDETTPNTLTTTTNSLDTEPTAMPLENTKSTENVEFTVDNSAPSNGLKRTLGETEKNGLMEDSDATNQQILKRRRTITGAGDGDHEQDMEMVNGAATECEEIAEVMQQGGGDASGEKDDEKDSVSPVGVVNGEEEKSRCPESIQDISKIEDITEVLATNTEPLADIELAAEAENENKESAVDSAAEVPRTESEESNSVPESSTRDVDTHEIVASIAAVETSFKASDENTTEPRKDSEAGDASTVEPLKENEEGDQNTVDSSKEEEGASNEDTEDPSNEEASKENTVEPPKEEANVETAVKPPQEAGIELKLYLDSDDDEEDLTDLEQLPAVAVDAVQKEPTIADQPVGKVDENELLGEPLTGDELDNPIDEQLEDELLMEDQCDEINTEEKIVTEANNSNAENEKSDIVKGNDERSVLEKATDLDGFLKENDISGKPAESSNSGTIDSGNDEDLTTELPEPIPVQCDVTLKIPTTSNDDNEENESELKIDESSITTTEREENALETFESLPSEVADVASTKDVKSTADEEQVMDIEKADSHSGPSVEEIPKSVVEASSLSSATFTEDANSSDVEMLDCNDSPLEGATIAQDPKETESTPINTDDVAPVVVPESTPSVTLQALSKFKSTFKDVTREDLEALVMDKMIEAVLFKSKAAENAKKIANQEKQIVKMQQKLQEVQRQFQAAEIMYKDTQKQVRDHEASTKGCKVTPKPVSRTVGIQSQIVHFNKCKSCGTESSSLSTLRGPEPLRSKAKGQMGNAKRQNMTVLKVPPNKSSISPPLVAPPPSVTMTLVSTGKDATKQAQPANGNTADSMEMFVDLTEDEDMQTAAAAPQPQPSIVMRGPAATPLRSLGSAPRNQNPQRAPVAPPVNSSTLPPLRSSQPAPIPTQTVKRATLDNGHNRPSLNQMPVAKHPAPLPQFLLNIPPMPGKFPKLSPPVPDVRVRQTSSGIILSWTLDLFHPQRHADIKDYQLYGYQATDGTPSPQNWKSLGHVKALKLPMAVTLTQFMQGQRYYFCVRARDIYARYGAFSVPGTW